MQLMRYYNGYTKVNEKARFLSRAFFYFQRKDIVVPFPGLD
mgnify:CR=1 FL=1